MGNNKYDFIITIILFLFLIFISVFFNIETRENLLNMRSAKIYNYQYLNNCHVEIY